MDANYVVTEYLSGKSGKKLAKEFSCHKRVIYRVLRENGIEVRNRRIVEIDVSVLRSLYVTEKRSVNEVATTFGVSRSAICRLLRSNGITPRTASEQEKIKWERMRDDPGKVSVQMAGAHKALRGHGEKLLVSLLQQQGLPTDTQAAFGPYHVDISITGRPLIIEVQRSYFSGPRLPLLEERMKYLLDGGFHVVYVMLSRDRRPTKRDLRGAADNIVAIANSPRLLKSYMGKYRVIRCTRDAVPFPCLDSKQFPRVPDTAGA